MQRMIRIVLPVLFLGVGALLLAGCAASGASAADLQKRQQAMAQSDQLIVPDQRIGPVRLGMDMDEVVAELGQPDFKGVMNGDHPSFRYWSLNLTVGFDNSSAPAVYWVETNTWTDSPLLIVFRTDNGIHIGSSSFEVKRAYGSPERSYPDTMIYDSRKFTFVIENYANINPSWTVNARLTARAPGFQPRQKGANF